MRLCKMICDDKSYTKNIRSYKLNVYCGCCSRFFKKEQLIKNRCPCCSNLVRQRSRNIEQQKRNRKVEKDTRSAYKIKYQEISLG